MADPGLPVALLARRADVVALAWIALDVRVAPVVGLALVAAAAAETRLALAGTVVWVTSGIIGTYFSTFETITITKRKYVTKSFIM